MRRVRRHLGVDERQLALTNGLDEGILAASVAALRGSSETAPFEAIVIVPAFDMYAACADAAGGRVVEVPSGDDFAFPLEQLLGAINSRTRIVFVTNPNNPTGLSVLARVDSHGCRRGAARNDLSRRSLR